MTSRIYLSLMSLAAAITLAAASPALAQSGTVEFQLTVTQGGDPVPGVTARIGSRFNQATDAQGKISVLIPSGNQIVALEQNDEELTRFSVRGRSGETVVTDVTLFSGGRLPDVDTEVIPVAVAGGGPGVLTGRVLASQGGDLTGASLFIEGANIDAKTDDDGSFQVEVPAGVYNVYAIHPDFSTQITENVRVVAGKTVELNIDMTPSGVNQLAEFVVLAPALQGTEAAALDTRRELSGVAEVLSADAISRAGDSDAAGALQRVTGLTVVDGKFVFVRGLGERYSSSLFNGSNLPSPDPLRRVVPLDLFPTSILDSVEVLKAYSPELPGDFAGGAIIMRGKQTPVDRLFELGASIDANSNTTGKDGLTYQGATTDYLGFDNGARELNFAAEIIKEQRGPDGQRLTVDATTPIVNGQALGERGLEAVGELFPVIYDPQPFSPGPGNGFDLSVGDLFELTENIGVGVILSGSYDNEYEIRDRFFADIDQNDLNDGLSRDTTLFRSQQTVRNVETSLFANIGLELGENHRITNLTMMLRDTVDTVDVRNGINTNEGTFPASQQTILEYQERQLLFNQLAGEHFFDFLWATGSKIDWQLGIAAANLYRPDTRQSLFEIDLDTGEREPLENDVTALSREYGEQDDEISLAGINFELPYVVSRNFALTAKAGLSYDQRERTSDVFRFGFDVSQLDRETRDRESIEDIINADTIRPNGAFLVDFTIPSDFYTAEQTITAGYLLADMQFYEALRLAAGARVEKSEQEVLSFALNTDANAGARSVGGQDETDFFPSLNATYAFTERVQVRGGFSQTVNRPDVRELSQAIFVDPENRREIVGNPDLVQADLNNFDLRFEYFPSPAELLSIGVFYKTIDRPIERITRVGPGSRVTFENAQEAEIGGIELEAGLNLGSYLQGWDAWSFTGNVSLIRSNSTPAADSESRNTDERDLQGQSDRIVNLNLGYDGFRGIKANLLYNFSSERISEVGILNRPNRLEQPFHAVDFTASMPFLRSYELKFKVRNLLDEDIEVRQGGLLQERVSVGQDYTLSIKADF